MKNTLLAGALILISVISYSQANPETPVDHMDYLNDLEQQLSVKYLAYMSEVAHGGKARKMEKRREDVVNSIKIAIRDSGKLRPYKGDASLRDAYRNYWNTLLSVFNEDYHKLVDMEEVAERSYDMMEAYLLIQEKAGDKLESEYDKVKLAYDAFAEKNGIRLVEGQTKLSRKLNQAGKVNSYMNQIFLIMFKSSIQEENMIDAFNKKDLNAVEQAKGSTFKYAIEGLAKLDTLKPFNGDGSMITACRKVLEFQKNEAENKFGTYVEFLLKGEEFEKVKKNIDTKPANARTQEDVDSYNQAMKEYNELVHDYNKVNNELNAARDKVRNNYETTRKTFIGRHTPHA